MQDVTMMSDADLPTVLITVLVRNKEHSLPYFFGCLENLNYPTKKISFFIRSDHNSDKSDGKVVIKMWIDDDEDDDDDDDNDDDDG